MSETIELLQSEAMCLRVRDACYLRDGIEVRAEKTEGVLADWQAAIELPTNPHGGWRRLIWFNVPRSDSRLELLHAAAAECGKASVWQKVSCIPWPLDKR